MEHAERLPAAVASVVAPMTAPARWLAQRWADCVMAEVHLDPAVRRVDYLAAWRVPAEDQGVRSVADLVGSALLAGPAATLAPCPLVWFEWDVIDGVPRAPLEFLCVTDTILGAFAGRRPPTDGLVRWRWIAEVLGGWAGEARWEVVGGAGTLVEALRASGSLMHIATLAPRGSPVVRLGFFADSDTVPDWLRRVRWPGDVDAVRRMLAEPALRGRRVGVQLDLGPALMPYVGLELPELRGGEANGADARAQIGVVARWAAVAADRAAVFEGWAGWDEGGATLRHGHLKLASAGGPWVAKMYLGRTRAGVAQDMRRWGRGEVDGILWG